MKKLVNIHKYKLLIVILFLPFMVWSQEKKEFHTLDEVLAFAKEKKVSFRNDIIQQNLAELTRKTAVGNAFNPRIPVSAQVIDNMNLQTNYIPAEVFGGLPGSFREITMGLQYVSTFSIQPQFDIINLGNISRIKLAKTNQELVANQQKINEWTIYDQLNGIYFNILSFQGQQQMVEQNIVIAKQILTIVNNRFEEGIVRKQDVNEAEVNLIRLQDQLSQLQFNIQIQQQNLALFFENEVNPILNQNIRDFDHKQILTEANNNLWVNHYQLREKVAEQEWKAAQKQQLPVLGFVSSFNWQNLSNESFFHPNSNWIRYNYVGLRLSWDLPTTVSKYSAVKEKKMQWQMAENDRIHFLRENETRNSNLLVEYEKTSSQLENFKKIQTLKEDTYQKYFDQYQENILPLDKLLTAQTDMLLSQLNVITALAGIGFSENKIIINNKF